MKDLYSIVLRERCEQLFVKKDHWKAFKKKFVAISLNKKICLLLKIALRMLGFRVNLCLGGYYKEEDNQQQIADAFIYFELIRNFACIAYNELEIYKTDVGEYNNYGTSCSLTNLIEEGQYIALMTEYLDNGGLEEVVRLLALELYSRNLFVKVFCLYSGGKIAEDLRKSGIEVIEFKGKKRLLKRYVDKNRPILVNTHYISKHLEVFYQRNIPVVDVIHNMYVFLNPQRIKEEYKKIYCVNEYIAVSDSAKRIFESKILKGKNREITVIGNSKSSVKTIFNDRKEIRESLAIEQEAYIFLVAGSIDPRKNQLGICRAWDIFSNIIDGKVYLLFAGSITDTEYGAKIKEFIEERKLKDRILFLGFREDLGSIMNAADVLILNSYYEGWSMAATEALCFGIPIIHSDCGSGKELVREGENGILIDNPLKNIEKYNSIELYNIMRSGHCDNIRQLIIAMLKMYSNRLIWEENKDLIKQRSMEQYSLVRTINKYLEIFAKYI